MKKVEAVIRHFKLEEVKNALTESNIFRHDDYRSPRLWTSKRSHGNVSWDRVRGRLSCPR